MKTQLFSAAIAMLALGSLSAKDIIINIKETGFDYANTRNFTVDASVGDVLVFTNNLNYAIGNATYTALVMGNSKELSSSALAPTQSFRYILNESSSTEFSFSSEPITDAPASTYINTFRVTLSTLGLSDQPNATAALALFPNPAKEQFAVFGLQNKASAHLINSAGKLVSEQSITAKESIDVQNLASGVYQVLIIEDNKQRVLKLVKN